MTGLMPVLLPLPHTSPFHREVRIRRFTSQLEDLTSSGFGPFDCQQKSSFLVGFSTMVGSTPGLTSFTETSSHVRILAANIAKVFWKLTHTSSSIAPVLKKFGIGSASHYTTSLSDDLRILILAIRYRKRFE